MLQGQKTCEVHIKETCSRDKTTTSARTWKCRRYISPGYAAATCPLVWTDTFLIVQHQFGDCFVPATCRAEFNLLNFMGYKNKKLLHIYLIENHCTYYRPKGTRYVYSARLKCMTLKITWSSYFWYRLLYILPPPLCGLRTDRTSEWPRPGGVKYIKNNIQIA